MAEHKVLYRNSDGVRRTSITDDDHPGVLRVYTEVQADAILKSIEEARDVVALTPRAANKHLARVPMTVYEQSILENWDEAKWAKWLNDPDNEAFRVWRGRV